MSTRWPRPMPLAREQRREDSLDREHAGRDVADGDADPERRSVCRRR